jgi:hypothetical protein
MSMRRVQSYDNGGWHGRNQRNAAAQGGILPAAIPRVRLTPLRTIACILALGIFFQWYHYSHLMGGVEDEPSVQNANEELFKLARSRDERDGYRAKQPDGHASQKIKWNSPRGDRTTKSDALQQSSRKRKNRRQDEPSESFLKERERQERKQRHLRDVERRKQALKAESRTEAKTTPRATRHHTLEPTAYPTGAPSSASASLPNSHAIQYERDLQRALAKQQQQHGDEYGDREDADVQNELIQQVERLSEHGEVDSARDEAIETQESNPSELESVLQQHARDMQDLGVVDNARDEALSALPARPAAVEDDAELQKALMDMAEDMRDHGEVDSARDEALSKDNQVETDAQQVKGVVGGEEGVCIADGGCATGGQCCSSTKHYAAACPSTDHMRCGDTSSAPKDGRLGAEASGRTGGGFVRAKVKGEPQLVLSARQQLKGALAGGQSVKHHSAPEDWGRLKVGGRLPSANVVSPMLFHLPAADWTSSFAIGNGRMGALLGWQPWEEKIPITDDTLWTPYEHRDYKKKPSSGQAMQDYAASNFKKHGVKTQYERVKNVRDLMWEGNMRNAQREAGKLSAGYQQSFSFIGDLHISLLDGGGDGRRGGKGKQEEKHFESYQRRLLMHEGTTQARFVGRTGDESADGSAGARSWHTREAFVSAVDDVMVMRYKCGAMPSDTSDKRGDALGGDACIQALQMYFTRPKSKNKSVPKGVVSLVQMGAGKERLQAMCLQNDEHQKGVDFATCVAIVDAGAGTNMGAHTGDSVGGSPSMGHAQGPPGGAKVTELPQKGGAGLASSGTLAGSAGGLMVLVATATSFHAPLPLAQCENKLLAAAKLSYEQLRTNHVKDFGSLAERSFLQLHPHGSEETPGADVLSAATFAKGLTTDQLLGAVHRRNRLKAVSTNAEAEKGRLWKVEHAKGQGAVDFYNKEDKAEEAGKRAGKRAGALGKDAQTLTLKQHNEAFDAVASAAELLMMEQLYGWGRYLLISSSRKGTQPMNLQGIWGNALEAQWHGDYHMNINLQMNYWAAQQVNLRETVSPLIEFVRELAVSGQATAKMYYDIGDVKDLHADILVEVGAAGRVGRAGAPWVAHGFTDIWMATPPYDEMQWAMCPTCGAWVALHLWEEFEYGWFWRGGSHGEGGDTTLASTCKDAGSADADALSPSCAALIYMRDIAFPVLRGSAAFFLRYLRDASTPPRFKGGGLDKASGSTLPLFTLPSTSPENSYNYVANSKPVSAEEANIKWQTRRLAESEKEIRGTAFLAAGPAFDTAVLSELFEAVTHAAQLLQQWGVCAADSIESSCVPKGFSNMDDFLGKVANAAGRLPNGGKPQTAKAKGELRGPILAEYMQASALDMTGEAGKRGEDSAKEGETAAPFTQELANAYNLLPKSALDERTLDAGHRHWSGVWAMYPGRQISPNRTPELAKAARRTIELKLRSDGGHTGWSAAWLASLWTRLHDGSR